MPRLEVDVGPLPAGAREVVLDYRDASSPTGAYLRLGETAGQVSRWDVPGPDPIVVRARVRDRNGRVWPGREETFTPSKEVDNRPDPADLALAEATVVQDGPALSIVQKAPEGSAPQEFQVEAVQTETADTSPKNGLHLGYHDPGDPVLAHAWPQDQKVWTRLVRKADERATAWQSQTVPTAKPLVDPTDGHTNDFAAGTIAKLGGSLGQEPLEISGGDLRHKDLYFGDAAGYLGDASYFMGDAGLRWGPATYTTANVTLPANEDLQFQFHPKLTSITRPTMYLGDALWPMGGPAMRVDIDGTIKADRLRRLNLTNFEDEVPIDLDVKVATSATSPATFADADFKALAPGKVHKNVKVYACRVVVRTWHGTRVTFDELRFWHWTWCRSRPWHTHSDAYELLYDVTTVADLASLTANVALNTWDDVRIEVQWRNADASASQLRIRFNNDSGSNYHKDGAAAATGLLVGPGTIASAWFEHAVVRVVNPPSGAERACRAESSARWNDTTSEAPGDEAAVMWDNTAAPITSVVFGATVGATPIASGSRFRIFGKRHHAS